MSSLPLTLQNKFRIDSNLGSGAFGVIYEGTDLSNGHKVAIKTESAFAVTPQLAYEYKLYSLLTHAGSSSTATSPTTVGVPRVYAYGGDTSWQYLVMDMMGPSLEELFQAMNQRFSLKTVLLLADQLLERIELLHNSFYIHRDIKPDNFVIGFGSNSHLVHMIDFGLAKRYRDPSTKQHVPYNENCQLTGTVRYASKSTHLGFEQSRRDDLESIGYLFVYFLHGSLPWQGLNKKKKNVGETQHQELIFQTKLKTSLQTLCQDLPVEFIAYFSYVASLGFYDKPDYNYLRSLFRNLAKKLHIEYDYIYDWTPYLQDVLSRQHTITSEQQHDIKPSPQQQQLQEPQPQQ